MSTDFYTKALVNFPQYSDCIVPNYVPNQLIKSSGLNAKPTYRSQEASTVVAQTRNIVILQPSTTVDPNLINGGLIDFRIEKGFIDQLDHIYIVLTLSNTTGASCTVQPSILLLDRWEVYGENGNSLLFQKYAYECFSDLIYLSRNEFEVMAPYMGFTSTYGAGGVTIANNATQVLYLPLISFFTPLKLCLAGLTGQLLLRLRFGASTSNVISGSSPSTTGCILQMRGRQLPEKIRNERIMSYHKVPLALPYLGIQRMSQQMTLSPSTTYSIVLSGIKGVASTFFFILRALPLTASNESTFIQVQSFDLQEQDSRSMIGYYRRTFADMALELAESFNNLMINYVNLHMIMFTNRAVSDYTQGTCFGYQSFTSWEKLSFTTTSSLPAGNYQLDIYASCHEYALINNGIIRTTRN